MRPSGHGWTARRMTRFTIEPVGRFSLAAAQGFAGGFAAGIGAHGTDTGLLMTFPVEGWRDSAAVDVWQTPDGTVHGEASGSDDIETVRRQAARSLSLDHDGRGWMEVGARDPVLGALQAQYDWLRPFASTPRTRPPRRSSSASASRCARPGS